MPCYEAEIEPKRTESEISGDSGNGATNFHDYAGFIVGKGDSSDRGGLDSYREHGFSESGSIGSARI